MLSLLLLIPMIIRVQGAKKLFSHNRNMLVVSKDIAAARKRAVFVFRKWSVKHENSY